MTTEDSIQPGPRTDGAHSNKLVPPQLATILSRADLRIPRPQRSTASMMRIRG